MPSVVPGFEYDIFISYRHKDNKGDHWVSEFVGALRTELESTFKEDISIYFDENPHDGLLETHDVSKSLEGKLKCLVFIPIISQTYCDPKSYAWQHEFCAFNKMVSQDGESFGREIKLKNGNVASRILPVRIHDLDQEDKQLLEEQLGSVLRAVEFIYKSAGVNRPLKPNDDRTANTNHTYYRDQINKVANAVKEIISGIKNAMGSVPNQQATLKSVASNSEIPGGRRRKRSLVIAMLTAVLVAVTYFIIQYSSAKINAASSNVEKSIAVLPFKSIGSDENDEHYSDGVTEELINSLSKVGELKVISHTSVEQYKALNKDVKAIAKELNVSYVLEGSVIKVGNKFRISARLIQPETNFSLWSQKYDKEMTDVFQLYTDISKEVTDALKVVLTDSEQQIMGRKEVVELHAYDFYLKARNELVNYRVAGPLKGLPHADNAQDFFSKAIVADRTFARAYTGLGVTLCLKGNQGPFIEKTLLDSAKVLADKAISLDKNVDEAYFILGLYYYQIGNENRAVEEFNKALKINPNYVDPMLALGEYYTVMKGDFVTGIPFLEKAIELERGPELAQNLRFTAFAYEFLWMVDKAAEYRQNAALLDHDSTTLLWHLSWVARANGNYEKALLYGEQANESDTTDFFGVDNKAWALTLLHRYDEALKVRLGWNNMVDDITKVPITSPDHRIGHLYWMLGDKKTARKYFEQFLAYGEKSIRDNKVNSRARYVQYDMACIYALLGDNEKAYQYLDMLNQKDFIPAFLNVLIKDDPMFESIRHEQRFKKLQDEMDKKNKRERDRVLKWLEQERMKTKLPPKM